MSDENPLPPEPRLLQVIDTKLNDEALTVTVRELKELVKHCMSTKLSQRCHWATIDNQERFLIPGCHEALYSEDPTDCTCDTLQSRMEGMWIALKDLRAGFDECEARMETELPHHGSPL